VYVSVQITSIELRFHVRCSQESDCIMSDAEVIPAQFSHSVKIEQTAKGARVTVHVNANSGPEAMTETVNLYRATKLQLERLNEIVAYY
jgi:hypothetical protein